MDEILHEMEKIEGTGLCGLEGWGWLVASKNSWQNLKVLLEVLGTYLRGDALVEQHRPNAQRASGRPRALGRAVTVTRARSEQHHPGSRWLLGQRGDQTPRSATGGGHRH